MNLQGQLIEHWQRHDEEKGIAPLDHKEYRRHAKVFTTLLLACADDVTLAKRVVTEFFEDKHPAVSAYGWDIGTFQKRYRGYLVRVREADARRAREAQRYQEQLMEIRERQGAVPPKEAAPKEVLDKTEALKRRMFGGR